jgi:hypothetical protein
MDPTFDGFPIFGTACHVVHHPNPLAEQFDSYFGVSGMTALYGGGRGRVFEVHGVLLDVDLPSVIADEALLLSFADGLTHIFVDTQGRVWNNILFQGEYRPSPEGPRPTDTGWCLPYHLVLRGLT